MKKQNIVRLAVGVAQLVITSNVLGAETQPEPAPSVPSATPEPAKPAVSAPDIILLNNGGILRGTISELVPGEQVTFITVLGETRSIAMSEVKYAGPAEQAPAASKEDVQRDATVEGDLDDEDEAGDAVAKPRSRRSRKKRKSASHIEVRSKKARVHFKGDKSDLTLHVRDSSAFASGGAGVAYAEGYQELCTAPCDVSMPDGKHTFALSRPGGRLVNAGLVNVPDGNSKLVGRYEDNRSTRIAGWVILGLGQAASLGMMYAAVTAETCSEGSYGTYGYTEEVCTPEVDGGMLAGAAIVSGVSLALGLTLGLTRDKATIKVFPGLVGKNGFAPRMARSESLASVTDGLKGLTLQASF